MTKHLTFLKALVPNTQVTVRLENLEKSNKTDMQRLGVLYNGNICSMKAGRAFAQNHLVLFLVWLQLGHLEASKATADPKGARREGTGLVPAAAAMPDSREETARGQRVQKDPGCWGTQPAPLQGHLLTLHKLVHINTGNSEPPKNVYVSSTYSVEESRGNKENTFFFLIWVLNG